MSSIVITSNTSWYLYNFRKNTIQALIDKGHQVYAIAPKDEYSVKLEALGARYVPVDIDQGGTNPIKDLKTFIGFLSIYRNVRPDVVLNFTPKNNIYSTVAAKIFGGKSVNNIAGLGAIFINQGVSATIAKWLYKFSQRFANTIFFQNEDDKALFLDNHLANPSITDRLPGSGVDLSRFSARPSDDDGKVRFLVVARMLYDKGIGHYVEAARKLKAEYGDSVECRLLGFVGVNNPTAVSKEEMQQWVDEGVVTYLGVSDKVEDEMAEVDCVVLPSFYREGVPKSLLEAGAMGKPIITTDNVGCRETVDHSVNGYLCEPKSTESLYAAMKEMIEVGHSKRLIMGQASREKMQSTFDEKIIINKYMDAVESALKA
ncbi:glycosyltransferase family 4 protein [Salinivibrio sp. YCSC6]|uniref:glycosyltransferase family 4 protein n=1 Tax=Salinivibrio sp. YCSC6 TaxID=2003370 RepID=UPI000BBC50EC|nr:glycosyltransferase family 4 protein [Salinivibrio sp. YCSC6]PCE67626.1 glycosyl transferase family 1 [Salinivibrio sp. YCSC6]QCF35473.1 glycosyltransferase family 1 protein [Salinivibrio sp. YCSC6]